jgi:hypothetical protein
MFHRSELGPLGERLPADLHGYVPQEGDRPEAFTWDPRTEWTAHAWSRFVDEAVVATAGVEEERRAARGADALLLAAGAIAADLRARDEDEEALLEREIARIHDRLARVVEEAEARARKTGRMSERTATLQQALVLLGRCRPGGQGA